MKTEKQKSRAGIILTCAALGSVLIAVSGCVVDPYPPPPAAYAPAPGYYGGGPYSYYDYPAYPYYGAPPVTLGFDFSGGDRYHGGYHHWH